VPESGPSLSKLLGPVILVVLAEREEASLRVAETQGKVVTVVQEDEDQMGMEGAVGTVRNCGEVVVRTKKATR
jgi:hypothetical protein